MTVLGYCIGGTLATCFAALHPEVTRNLVLLTAPLDFSDAGQFGRMTARGIFPDRAPDRHVPDGAGTAAGHRDEAAQSDGELRRHLSPELWDKLGVENFDVQGLAGDVPLGERQRPIRRGGVPPVDRRVLPGEPAGAGHARDGRPAGPPGEHPLPGPQHRRQPRSDRAPRDHEHRHGSASAATDVRRSSIEGGHVGIVVGRSASQNLWPKVGAWLSEHD